jgi:hypothetical protein
VQIKYPMVETRGAPEPGALNGRCFASQLKLVFLRLLFERVVLLEFVPLRPKRLQRSQHDEDAFNISIPKAVVQIRPLALNNTLTDKMPYPYAAQPLPKYTISSIRFRRPTRMR